MVTEKKDKAKGTGTDRPAESRMPANVPHAVRAGKRFKMILTMLRSK